MRETAYAKLNLALHVRERLPDGYHRIETVFAFCEDGDTLTVAEGEEVGLEIIGSFANVLKASPDNLVLRAARALRERFGTGDGASLTLDKRLPVAAGIGGGSADAAAALRLLDRWWELDAAEDELLDIAAGLGADVPACLFSRPARGEGKGDQLAPRNLEDLSGVPVLLVNPNVPLSTAAVFQAWDGIDRGPLEDWREGRNDLEPPAKMLVPEIGPVLEAMTDAEFARMSGSGATCFGLFATEAVRDAAAVDIEKAHTNWWQLLTRIR